MKTAVAVALAASALTLAPAAHADSYGVDVAFAQQQRGVDVTIRDTQNIAPQQCTYEAKPIPPTQAHLRRVEFPLLPAASVTMAITSHPGQAWDVSILCSGGGRFSDTVHY
jgi:hypothetical protein